MRVKGERREVGEGEEEKKEGREGKAHLRINVVS